MRRLVPLVALLLLPAAAGEMTLSPQDAATPLVPGGQPVPLAFEVSLPCQDVFPRLPEAEVRVRFSATAAHPGILLTYEDEHLVPEDACVAHQGTYDFTHVFLLAAGHDVPGETPLEVKISAQLEGQGLHEPAREKHALALVEVAYAGLLQVRVPSAIHHVDGAPYIELHVANVGNAVSRVEVEAVQVAAGRVEAPEALLLESPTTGRPGTNITVSLRFIEPEGAWEQVTLRLQLTPSSTKDPGTKGEPVTVHLLMRNGGMDRYVPGPPLPLLLGALALLAWRRP